MSEGIENIVASSAKPLLEFLKSILEVAGFPVDFDSNAVGGIDTNVSVNDYTENNDTKANDLLNVGENDIYSHVYQWFGSIESLNAWVQKMNSAGWIVVIVSVALVGGGFVLKGYLRSRS